MKLTRGQKYTIAFVLLLGTWGWGYVVGVLAATITLYQISKDKTIRS